MIVDNQISVTEAAQHYSSAHRRGVSAGKYEEHHRIMQILQEMHDSGPYNVETKVGIQLALAKIKNDK